MKTILLASLCVIAIIFNSCTNNSNDFSEKKENTFEKIQRTKELHVGYFIFEPTITKNKDDKLEGVFIELIEKIAKSINPDTKIIYHPTTLSTFHTDLNTNQFDLCIGATFATPKRASIVSFSKPLFYCGYTGVTSLKNKNKFLTWNDVDKPNIKIAVLQGSAIADLVSADFTNKDNIKYFPGSDLTIPLAAVSSDQADVGLMNQITVFTYLREHPELTEIMGENPLATTYFSWAFRLDDEVWRNYINTCIDYFINTGEMYKIEKKYNVPMMHIKNEFYFPINN